MKKVYLPIIRVSTHFQSAKYCCKWQLQTLSTLWDWKIIDDKRFAYLINYNIINVQYKDITIRDHFVYVPSQWETMLQCDVIFHWLGAYTKWSLHNNMGHVYINTKYSVQNTKSLGGILSPCNFLIKLYKQKRIIKYKTRYVDGTPTSEIIPVTIRYIHPPHHGYP